MQQIEKGEFVSTNGAIMPQYLNTRLSPSYNERRQFQSSI